MYTDDLKLNDLLSDPLVRLVMASDGVEEAHIRKLARRVTLRSEMDGTRRDRLATGGGALRHTPSCRDAWRAAPPAQPSI